MTTQRRSALQMAVYDLIAEAEEAHTSRGRALAALYRSLTPADDIEAYRRIATAFRKHAKVEPRRHHARAIRDAMRLWAEHHRLTGGRGQKEDVGLGEAVARVPMSHREGVLRRLRLVATTTNSDDLRRTIGGVTNILGSEGIRLDFALLASQIHSWPFAESRHRTIQTWAIEASA